jgi:exonuclease SbcC
MKILAIRGNNLASLRGEFELNLQSSPLNGNGIFVIAGPTGAGKSTLLDALCLSLFDAVPRFDNASNHDPRTVLSHGAGEGYCETDFQGLDGQKYQARWEVRRARGETRGRLQPQQMSVVLVQTGEKLGRTKREVLQIIEERLGLSYTQFRRSALLAQGDFAAFLKAPERERSELLERMTGTEIYTRISILCHERASMEKQKELLLRESIGRLFLMEPIVRRSASKELREAKGVIASLTNELQKLEKQSQWLKTLEHHHSAERRAQQKVTDWRNTWNHWCKHLRDNLDQLGGLPVLKQELESIHRQLIKTEQEVEKAKSSCAEKAKTADAAKHQLKELDAQAEMMPLDTLQEKRKRQEEVRARLVKLQTMSAELIAYGSRLRTCQKTIKEADDPGGEKHRLETDQREVIEKIEKEEAQLRALTLSLDLDQHRQSLEEGSPCPLCGSPSHPWTEHGSVQQTTESTKKSLRSLRQKHQSQTVQLSTIAERQKQASHQAEETQKEIESIRQKQAVLKAQWDATCCPQDLDQAELLLAAALKQESDAISLHRRLRESRFISDRHGAALEREEKNAARIKETLNSARVRQQQIFTSQRQCETRRREIINQLSHSMLDERLEESHPSEDLHTLTVDYKEALSNSTEEWADNLQTLIQKIREEGARRDGQFLHATQSLTEHAAAEQTSESPEQIGHRLNTVSKQRASAERILHTTSLRLEQDKATRKEAATLKAQLDAQSSTTRLWETLRELIGSADGSKFRKFAQSLTLDTLLGYTNQQLIEMAPRYQIRRVSNADLELEVVDREMGDEVRSAHSLSGGESFLVSLALALGLASLSSHHVQVDTLFIDEGFGALDVESLDVSINALDSLQAQGRQIGIISHLPLLIERIGLHVSVEPQGGGRSILVAAN